MAGAFVVADHDDVVEHPNDSMTTLRELRKGL